MLPRRWRRILAPVRTLWRRLTSMRTALVLLFLLAVAALLGGACRGHDILYSTAILKKTGLRLRED